MDFTKYLYVMIGKRLEKKIDELYKTKTEFLKKLDDDDKKKNKREYLDLPIPNSALSNIIRGKTVKSPYLISREHFNLLSKEFNLTSQEFIFGSDSEIINFIKFSFILILFNDSDINPYMDNFSNDDFFSNELNRKLFKDSLKNDEILRRTSNKLLLNIILAINDEKKIDFYIEAFKHYYNDSLEFSINFARFFFSNKLDTNFLFDYLFSSKYNYQIFVESFNAFINTNRTALLEFYNKTIYKKINEKSSGKKDSTLSKINNKYFINLFSDSLFLDLLDQTLNDEQFTLFLQKATQEGKKISFNNTNNHNLGYYDKEKLEEDIKQLQIFYEDNRDNNIHTAVELNLHILHFLNLGKFLENQLIDIDKEDDSNSQK